MVALLDRCIESIHVDMNDFSACIHGKAMFCYYKFNKSFLGYRKIICIFAAIVEM